MVVIVDEGKYPQDINIEFVQDKVALLDSLQPGQQVTVTFDIRGREYNGRYFNNLQGWKIDTPANETASGAIEQAPFRITVTTTAIFRSRDYPAASVAGASVPDQHCRAKNQREQYQPGPISGVLTPGSR